LPRRRLRAIVGVLTASLAGLWLFAERGRLLLPSTWRLIRAGGLRRLFNPHTLNMYIYNRWTDQYLDVFLSFVLPRLGERGKAWLRHRYHGKVLTQELAEAVVTLDHDIPLQDLEQIIPYAMARDLVLTGPPDIAAYECSCRRARENPCQPTQVCMIIGQPFVDFHLEHNPHSSRRLTQIEALALLQAEHERGHVHTAWFKESCLSRFYVICNCCKCCCAGIEAMVKYGNPLIASSGFVARVDPALCTSCGLCVEACPFGALSLNGSANGAAVVEWAKCMGCGICVGQCPSEAATLRRDERKGVPMDVRLLS